MSELRKHLEALNAEKLAWVAEDPDNRWTGLYVTDEAHWAERGVHTVEEFEHYEMAQSYYDLYKDVFGIRPRWMDFNAMSTEELRKEYDWLLGEMEAAATEEEKRQQRSLEEFEALLESLRKANGIDTATAIRWLMEAENCEQFKYDFDYFAYHYGLSRKDTQFYYEALKGYL